MNEEMIGLSHRVVACKNWRWLPGMRCLPTEGMVTVPLRLTDDLNWPHDLGLRLPDISDPATLGCLLALVREAWVDPTASTAATREVDGTRGWIMDCWDPKSPLNGIGPFKSEAEAIIAALEATP